MRNDRMRGSRSTKESGPDQNRKNLTGKRSPVTAGVKVLRAREGQYLARNRQGKALRSSRGIGLEKTRFWMGDISRQLNELIAARC